MKCLQERWRRLENLEYVSIDLKVDAAMYQMDVTQLLFPNDTFDCIICFHVLEHVVDDKRAMRELFRVLKPGGWAIIQSPVASRLPNIIEGKRTTDPAERLRRFGKEDHLRAYGADYPEKLERAGFRVTIDAFVRTLSEKTVLRYSLPPGEDLYICKKPAGHDYTSAEKRLRKN